MRLATAWPPWLSVAHGVRSNEYVPCPRCVAEYEYSLPLVGCSHITGAEARPARVIPDLGQVSEYVVKSSVPDGGHVLHDDELGSYDANTRNNVFPYATSCSFLNASFLTSRTNVLTGEAGADDVNWLNVSPIQFGEITEIWYARKPGCQDGPDMLVVVSTPDELSAEDGHNGHVQATVACAQGADTRSANFLPNRSTFGIFEFLFHHLSFKLAV